MTTMSTITPPPPVAASLPPGSPLPPPAGMPLGRAPAPAPRWSKGTRRMLTVVGVGIAAIATLQIGVLAVDLLARRDRVETFTYPSEVVQSLEVRTSAGSVRVVGSERTDIAVRAEIREGLADADVRAVATGGTLRLDDDCGPFFLPTSCRINFVVEVPFDLPTTVHTSGGSVRVEALTGPVRASASGGSVRLVGVSGPVDAHSSAGSVVGEDLRSDTVQADSSAGSVRLTFASAPTSVQAESSAGSVTVAVPDDDAVYRVEASTSAGSERVEVRTDPRSDRVIDVRSSAGSVTVRYGDAG